MHCAARNFSECPPLPPDSVHTWQEPPGAWTFIGSTPLHSQPYGRIGRHRHSARHCVCGPPVRHVASDTEVLEVSSAAKDVERETLRIRHTFCSPSSPGKEAKDEPPCPNGILPQNQNSRNLKYLIRVTDVYDIWFSIRKRLNIYAARKDFDFRRPGPSG